MPESADWRIAVTPLYAFFLKFARNALTFQDADDVDIAIRFMAAESTGMGHGRFRARLCRLLKHFNLTNGQQRRLGDAIGRRLLAGRFSEQFFCQLRALARIDYPALQY